MIKFFVLMFLAVAVFFRNCTGLAYVSPVNWFSYELDMTKKLPKLNPLILGGYDAMSEVPMSLAGLTSVELEKR